MRKKIILSFVLIVLSFVALMPTGFASVEESNVAAAFVMTPVADAKEHYTQHCARCHGADGRGKTALGKTFKAPDLTSATVQRRSDSRFTKSITKGRGNMPAFAKKLSAQDIIALIAYVRSLKK